jgi:hypothetical protein
MVERLLAFTRTETTGTSGPFLVNFSSRRSATAGEEKRQEQARNFLRDFCKRVWFSPYHWEEQFRPRVIERLFVLDHLDDLLPEDAGRCLLSFDYRVEGLGQMWQRFDPACLDTIEKCIRARGFPSVEEAIRQGNRSAILLVALRVALQEQGKVDEIARLKKLASDAADRLKALGK